MSAPVAAHLTSWVGASSHALSPNINGQNLVICAAYSDSPFVTRFDLSVIYIPQAGGKSDQATLIELLDEVEAFLCELVISGEDSIGTRIFGSKLYDAMIEAWRGDPAVPNSGVEDRFSAARLKLATMNSAVLAAAGLSGARLQVELISLLKRADDYNEYGGKQQLAKVFRQLDRLLKSAGLENVLGKLRNYLWASLVEDVSHGHRVYH